MVITDAMTSCIAAISAASQLPLARGYPPACTDQIFLIKIVIVGLAQTIGQAGDAGDQCKLLARAQPLKRRGFYHAEPAMPLSKNSRVSGQPRSIAPLSRRSYGRHIFWRSRMSIGSSVPTPIFRLPTGGVLLPGALAVENSANRIRIATA